MRPYAISIDQKKKKKKKDDQIPRVFEQIGAHKTKSFQMPQAEMKMVARTED
jgi:hypothetical protein